jgi:dihydrofolate reductase
MRKLIESTLLSLDGVIDDPASWGIEDYFDDAFQKGALERLLESDAMVMGRRTYELLARDWSGTDLALYGHGPLAQTLLNHGLLDEMRISIFPVFVGRGKLLFRDGERARLRLIEATSLPTGVVVMRYQPAGVTEAHYETIA